MELSVWSNSTAKEIVGLKCQLDSRLSLIFNSKNWLLSKTCQSAKTHFCWLHFYHFENDYEPFLFIFLGFKRWKKEFEVHFSMISHDYQHEIFVEWAKCPLIVAPLIVTLNCYHHKAYKLHSVDSFSHTQLSSYLCCSKKSRVIPSSWFENIRIHINKEKTKKILRWG